MSTICEGCGAENPIINSFCGRCGTKLSRACANCGVSSPPNARFCGNCGTGLTQTAPQPTELGEQREVTVLFLDIENYTNMSRGLENEDVYNFINEAMKLFVNVLKKYGGVVDKFTGNGLMALFGAPVAHENDPELAVRSGLEMLEQLIPLQQQVQATHGLKLQARIGINTGTAIAGQLGSNLHQEYTVIGNTVNLAARLESSAEPGTVLVSEETYRRTQAFFNYAPVPGLRLKGITEPVTGYRPLNLRRKPGNVRGLSGIETPLVGRNKELSQLKQALKATQESRRSHLVVISGEAGLGKSRLLLEFRKEVESPGVPCYQGTNYPHTRAIPYATISRLLQDIFQIAENDPPEEQYRNLMGQINGHLGLESPGDIYLLNILGLERFHGAEQDLVDYLDPQILQRQTFVAMRRLLAGEASRSPIVVIVDDAHWIDAASRDLMLYLWRALSDLPILFVVLTRPVEQKSPTSALLDEAERNQERVTHVQLKALSYDRTVDLLGHFIVAADLQSERLIRNIAGRAEGVPYYVEELVRMLIDNQALAGDGVGPYRATDKAEELLSTVPGTLSGLLLTRFDSLDEQARQVLQRAVVLGRSFPVSLLQELCHYPRPTLGAILDDLEGRLFLRAEEFGSQKGYAFRHSLVRSTIHNTLLRRTRRQLHGQVAEVIEHGSFFSEDDRTEALGYHYSESEQPHKGIPHLIVSAENAASRGAHETALSVYRRCLSINPDGEDWSRDDYCRIRLGMGRTLKLLGELTEAAQYLREGVARLGRESAGISHRATTYVQMQTELGDVLLRSGLHSEGWESLELARTFLQEDDLFRHGNTALLHSALLDRMAWALLRQGELDEATELAQQALAGLESEQGGHIGLRASLYNILGGVYYQKGIPARAIQYVRMSLNLYEQLDYSWGVASTLGNLGVLFYMQGMWSEAAEYYERAEVIRREHGFAAERALNLYNLALLRASMGDHSRAIESFRTSLAIGRQLGDLKLIGCCFIGLGQLADVQGRGDDLRTYVEAATEHVSALGDDHKTHLLLLESHLNKYAGDFSLAIHIAQTALRLAESANLSEELVESLRVLGVLYRASGQHRKAEDSLRRSLQLSQERRDPYHQGLAELELAHLFSDQQADCPDCLAEVQQKTRDVLISAASHFEEVGASYDLELTRTMLCQLG